jgi:hypothetical protein
VAGGLTHVEYDLESLLTFPSFPLVIPVLRVAAFLWEMAQKWKQDGEQRKKSEDQREMLLAFYGLLVVVLAIVAVVSINYRMVPRSLPA